MKLIVVAGVLFACWWLGRHEASAGELQRAVFVSGEGGYHTYRIPALVVTQQGTLLAFAEGRKSGQGDAGDIALLLRRSKDNGQTWSDLKVIWADPGNTCGNPCPIVDRDTGTIHLLVTWNRGDDPEPRIIDQTSKDTRRVFTTASEDDGVTWAEPREITAQVKREDWTWYATGPGAGIQIERGPHEGRLVAPCDHIEAGTKHYYSHVIFSDDHGATWQLGGRTPKDQVNECQVIEVSGDRLLLNARNYDRTKRARQVIISDDGGATWHGQRFDEALVEPICQASLRAHGWTVAGKRQYTLFSNPASVDKREKMTVRISGDEGETWPHTHELHAGPSAYSDLAILPGPTAACLFECGDAHPYERIDLTTFPLSEEE